MTISIHLLLEELLEELKNERNHLINELGMSADNYEPLNLSGKIYMINRIINKLEEMV